MSLKNSIYQEHIIASITENLGVGDNVKDEAISLFKRAVEANSRLKYSHLFPAMPAATVYAAIRLYEIPRDIKEVQACANVGLHELKHNYRQLVRTLDLKLPIADPKKYIPRLGSQLGVKESTCRKAMEILNQYSPTKWAAGKDPRSVAAAALYVACVLAGEYKTQADFRLVTGIPETTIRSRYRSIKLVLNL